MTVCNGWHWLWGNMGRTAPASDDPSFLVAVHVPTIHYSGIPRLPRLLAPVFSWNSRPKVAYGDGKVNGDCFCLFVTSGKGGNWATVGGISRRSEEHTA